MYQNHRNAPPSLRASSASSCSIAHESAALMLSCSGSSRSNHAASSGPHSPGSASSAKAKKYSAWPRLMASALLLSSSFSSANSWIVSSITKCASPSDPSLCCKRLLSKSEETPSNTSTGRSPRASHTASIASRAAPLEKTPSLPKSIFSLIEQPVAPFNGAPESPLPLGQVSCPAGEHLEAIAQAGEQRLRGQQLYPCCGELYGQGQPVQPRADLRHRRGILLCHGEVGSDGPGPIYEEPDRPIPGEVLNGREGSRVRQREGGDGKLVLAVELQRGAACGQDCEAGSYREQLVQERRRLKDLLEIVQH